ncbi:hypothetical protein FD733_16410 [Pantoea sp. Eser]|nr:hypothetical protein [Pantoea sp. Eser]
MHFSFSKGSSIERLTHYPQIEIKELARALADVDPNLRNDELQKDKTRIIGAYCDYLIRVNRNSYALLKSQGKQKELDLFYPKSITTNCPMEETILFSSCFILLEKDVTPDVLVERCIQSLSQIYKKYGEALIFQCGGEKALLIAKENAQDKRGAHKKDEENPSLHKIMGLLAINLAMEKSASGSTKWINNAGFPSIEPLHRLLSDYAKSNGISQKGMGKSSFYDKLRTYLNSLYDE